MQKKSFPVSQLPTNISPDQWRSVKSVAAFYDIGTSTVWKWVKEGRLPPPVRFGKRCSRWKYGTLLATNKKFSSGRE